MNTLKSIPISLYILAIAAGLSSGGPAAETSSSVTYFDHDKVDAAFAKSGILFAGQAGQGNYKVLTARRDRPGEVEIHSLDTDIIYVVSGTATFITGGAAIAAKTMEANELRGKSIQGGTAHHLAKGDVIIVPHGTPHWFSEVPGQFLYFVVKVH